jgi:ribosome-binding protein aMBF1 (putative translation factor)
MSKSGPKPKAEAERFWAKVDKTSLCWLWTGAVNLGQRGKGGYGKFMVRKINGRGIFEASHRWAYRNCVGPIPPGLHVLHKCDNRVCVRPDHLFVGSAQDNVNDMITKGRHGGPSGKTHPKAKLNETDIVAIQRRYAAGGVSQRQLAEEYGVDPSSVSRIVRGESWAQAVPTRPMMTREQTRAHKLENLRRGERHYASKLSSTQVRQIRRRYDLGGVSQAKLAREYRVSQTTIGHIVRGKSWKATSNSRLQGDARKAART